MEKYKFESRKFIIEGKKGKTKLLCAKTQNGKSFPNTSEGIQAFNEYIKSKK